MGKKQIVVRPEESLDPKKVYSKKKIINNLHLLKVDFYEKELRKLEIELVKFQNWVKKTKQKIVVIIEGRDGAGKGGTIRVLTTHLNPRGCRVVALPKPSEEEKTEWYFKRYISTLPAGGEIVFFDRSWYNRAGVEKVMGFCTQDEYKDFIYQVSNLEQMLVASGTMIFKYFLNVSKEEQRRRIERRNNDPLRRWKLSPIDAKSLNLWDEYTEAFEKMFSRTHTPFCPWVIVDSNDKKRARLNLARDLLSKVDYEDKDQNSVCLLADPNIVHLYLQQSSFIKKNKNFKIFKDDKKDTKDDKSKDNKKNEEKEK